MRPLFSHSSKTHTASAGKISIFKAHDPSPPQRENGLLARDKVSNLRQRLLVQDGFSELRQLFRNAVLAKNASSGRGDFEVTHPGYTSLPPGVWILKIANPDWQINRRNGFHHLSVEEQCLNKNKDQQ